MTTQQLPDWATPVTGCSEWQQGRWLCFAPQLPNRPQIVNLNCDFLAWKQTWKHNRYLFTGHCFAAQHNLTPTTKTDTRSCQGHACSVIWPHIRRTVLEIHSPNCSTIQRTVCSRKWRTLHCPLALKKLNMYVYSFTDPYWKQQHEVSLYILPLLKICRAVSIFL